MAILLPKIPGSVFLEVMRDGTDDQPGIMHFSDPRLKEGHVVRGRIVEFLRRDVVEKDRTERVLRQLEEKLK